MVAEPAQMPASPAPARTPAPDKMKMFTVMPPPGTGKWWKDSRVVQETQLTPVQISDLEKSFLDHRVKLIQLRAALEVAETQLEAMLEADQPDQAKVIAQIDQVTQARGALEKENAMMMLGVRRVLSVEQWKILQAMQQRQFRKVPMPPPLPPAAMPRKHSLPSPGEPPQRPPDV
jgi:Spy/CpxP family protein refolding chaperone